MVDVIESLHCFKTMKNCASYFIGLFIYTLSLFLVLLLVEIFYRIKYVFADKYCDRLCQAILLSVVGTQTALVELCGTSSGFVSRDAAHFVSLLHSGPKDVDRENRDTASCLL